MAIPAVRAATGAAAIKKQRPSGMASVCDVRKTVAGEEGLEPSHAGIKIRCLDQLGDSPTQEDRATSARTPELSQVVQPPDRLSCARYQSAHQSASGCTSMLLQTRTCQPFGASCKAVLLPGKAAKTAVPEPLM